MKLGDLEFKADDFCHVPIEDGCYLDLGTHFSPSIAKFANELLRKRLGRALAVRGVIGDENAAFCWGFPPEPEERFTGRIVCIEEIKE